MFNTKPTLPLPAAAESIVWQIFGEGASPRKSKTTYDIIEPMIRGGVSAPLERDQAIAEIRGWFEHDSKHRFLKQEFRKPVAELIIAGIQADHFKRLDRAVWAVGSIAPDISVGIIRACWSNAEQKSFVDAAVRELEQACALNVVLDPKRAHLGIGDERAEIPKDALRQGDEGILSQYGRLREHGFELVHHALHPAMGHLIEVIVALRPACFEPLVNRMDHPIPRIRAAEAMAHQLRLTDHAKILSWIGPSACDALIALGILETLTTVNGLEHDVERSRQADPGPYPWSTDLHGSAEVLEAAPTALIRGMVDRLGLLDPSSCARWVGELLAVASYHLNHIDRHRPIPLRVDQLEHACTDLISRLLMSASSSDVLASLRQGSLSTPRGTEGRHLAAVAWKLRAQSPERAVDLARMVLEQHDLDLAQEIERDYVFIHWHDWHYRDWIQCLGVAVALSGNDPREWVLSACSRLPLSIWDSEERHMAFMTADRAAQQLFLVGFHAFAALRELGRPVPTDSLRALVEKLWDHLRFVARRTGTATVDAVVAERSACIVAELAEPSDVWLLDSVRRRWMGPRALSAMVDQRALRSTRDAIKPYEQEFLAQLAVETMARFGDGKQFGFESLWWWANLWLRLGATQPMEQTAFCLMAQYPWGEQRPHKIMVLKLLAKVVATGIESKLELQETIDPLYRELWRHHVPDDERDDKANIDDHLARVGVRVR